MQNTTYMQFAKMFYSQGHVWPSSYGIVTAIFLRRNFVREPLLELCCFNLKVHARGGIELEHMIMPVTIHELCSIFEHLEGLFSQNALNHSL